MSEYLTSVNALQRLLNERVHLDVCLTGASALAQQISYGVTRNYYALSAVLEALLDKPLAGKHDDLRLLLLCGLYSIEQLKRPHHASVNIAVDTASRLQKPWAKGLINGVLRRYAREQEALRSRAVIDNSEARFNHPAWLISLIDSAWDRPDIFAANQARPPMTLRINGRKSDRADYLKVLENANIPARPGSVTATAVVLDQPMKVNEIPGFNEGLVSVQDEGAQLAATLLRPEPGAVVLDACAAPGGKTGHLLERTDIRLTAVDRDRKRIHQINENLERLGLQADVHCADLLDWQTDLRFDRILLDAPCSATGIIRRHPDIMLLRAKSDIDKLFRLQSLLLDKVFDLLVSGGELLYSTCSILPQENDSVINDFLSSRPEAEVLPIGSLPETDNHVKTPYGLQLLPTVSEHDGFYYARLRRSTH